MHHVQAAVAALPEEAWTYEYQAQHSAVMAGREGNQNAFKPGGPEGWNLSKLLSLSTIYHVFGILQCKLLKCAELCGAIINDSDGCA